MSLLVAMALSELDHEQWNGQVKSIYDKGDFLVNIVETASTSSVASSTSATATPSDLSSTPPLSPDYLNLFKLLDIKRTYHNSTPKDFTELILQSFCRTKSDSKKKEKDICTCIEESHKYNDELKITYDRRDLLDLGSNLKENWDLTPAVLPKDIQGYFQNRSQISWLNGATPPRNRLINCKQQDCNFDEVVYY